MTSSEFVRFAVGVVLSATVGACIGGFGVWFFGIESLVFSIPINFLLGYTAGKIASGGF